MCTALRVQGARSRVRVVPLTASVAPVAASVAAPAWGMAMATPFVSLTPTQREAVRKLGFSPHDWDKRVQAMSMGKNA